jgi:hypothetical protein
MSGIWMFFVEAVSSVGFRGIRKKLGPFTFEVL